MESSAAPSIASSAGKKRKRKTDPSPLQELVQNSSSSSSSLSSSSSAAPVEESEPAKRQKESEKPGKHVLSKEEIAELLEKGGFFQVGGDEPVYDDCNEVRNKIRAFLRTKRMTQTAFLKTLGINSNSYRHFMHYMGKTQGSNNGLYPAAYRFFESLRILEGRPKSAKRVGAEAIFGPQGRSLERSSQFGWVPKGHVLVEDEWGRVRSVPRSNV